MPCVRSSSRPTSVAVLCDGALGRGHAAYIAGDLERAGNFLAKATPNEAAQTIVRVLSASIDSLVEAEHGHQDRALELADLAMDMVEARGLHSMPQASMAFTARARTSAASGDMGEARACVDQGLAVRRRNPTLSPWPMMHHLLVAASVAVDQGQVVRAGELLDEARMMMDRYPVGMDWMQERLASTMRGSPRHRPVRSSRCSRSARPTCCGCSRGR